MNSSAFKMVRGRTPGMHAVFAQSAHTFARHTHEDFGIGVITSGAQRWHSGRAQVEAGPGSAIAVNAGEVHDGSPIDERGRTWRMLYISPSLLRAAGRDVFTNSLLEFEFPSPVFENPRVAHLVLRLFAAESGGATDQMQSEELLLAMIAQAGVWRSPNHQSLPASVARAKQCIDDDPSFSHSLGDLAQLSGVSRFQLLRSFARTTGFTPHAYVVQRRIDVARQLICRGEELAEVAAATGFADQSHMTRTFVQKYGVPPGAYARAVR